MEILRLPRQALTMMLGNRVLFLLAFLPGILTLCFTSAALYLLWKILLHDLSHWISFPLMLIATPVFWIAGGNIALIPVEDRIIDRVQIAVWSEIRIPAPPFSLGKFYREIRQSIFITVFFLLLILLTIVPGFAVFTYVFGAWATAWSFLATVYSRQHKDQRLKFREFFRHVGENTLLGIFLNLLLFLPVLNVWLLGYALILATLLEMQRGTSELAQTITTRLQ